MNKVIIIGGGAAGYFTAINAKEKNPDLDITILEKGNDVLQKVKISGGGRCNVTHACFEPKELVAFYPRGGKELLGPFHQFMTGDTFEWFDDRGVPLKIENDNRVFPEANTSQAIIDCFQKAVDNLGIKVLTNHGVNSIDQQDNSWVVNTKQQNFEADKVVIAAGSSKKVWELCETLDHRVVNPVPSLFTFNIKDKRLTDLLGISVPNATVKIQGTKLEASGPLLITHWGMSGPVILKASSIGARELFDKKYFFELQINWLIESNTEVLFKILENYSILHSKKFLSKQNPFNLPSRLWSFLITKFIFFNEKKWGELGKKNMRKLIELLTKDIYKVSGKTTFKEEFVTCGGVSLESINIKTMQSKIIDDLYFAGEVLDIDGITGGYNFQSAWSTGYIAGKLGIN